MAKLKRLTVGSICKGKDETRKDYLKLRGDTIPDLVKALQNASPEKGLSLILESKQFQIASINSAMEAGKLSEEVGNKMIANAEKTPDYVRFSAILLTEAH